MYLIDFKKAKRFYKLFSSIREVKQFKNIKILYKKPYLILSNLFDRDIFSSEFCINESLFHIGYKNFIIEKDLFSTFTRYNKLTINIGRFFCNNNKKKIKNTWNSIKRHQSMASSIITAHNQCKKVNLFSTRIKAFALVRIIF